MLEAKKMNIFDVNIDYFEDQKELVNYFGSYEHSVSSSERSVTIIRGICNDSR